MTTRILIIVLFLAGFVPALKAQKIEIDLRAYPSSWYNGWFEPGVDGGALIAGYHHPLSGKYYINITGEYAILGSRNELLLGTGIRRILWEKNRFRLSAEANLLNGMGLYRPAPLYSGGGEILFQFAWRIGKKLNLHLGAGGRYTLCPGYREFGVWRYNSWPVGIGIGF